MTLIDQVVGIDPSSKKLAFCSTDPLAGPSPVMHKISLPVGVLQATGAAYREAFLFFQENPDMVVYMEQPLVGRSAYSTIIQAQVGGAVLAAADNAGVKIHLVHVSRWKKQVVGNGAAKKEQIAEWLRDNWQEAYNLCGGDQDLVDASALNRYGFYHERIRQAILKRINRASKAEEAAVGS